MEWLKHEPNSNPTWMQIYKSITTSNPKRKPLPKPRVEVNRSSQPIAIPTCNLKGPHYTKILINHYRHFQKLNPPTTTTTTRKTKKPTSRITPSNTFPPSSKFMNFTASFYT